MAQAANHGVTIGRPASILIEDSDVVGDL